ncbi:MAG: purine-nucleoside phosphorylase [Rikenellaceae bacterium]
MLEKIKNTATFIRNQVNFEPEIGIVLGSGLGGLTQNIDIVASIEYKDIPGFPVSTVEGHAGRFVFGMLGGRKVVAMQGRFHYYEGYEMWQIILPIRVMKFLGIQYLFVSNAAGGLNPTFKTGSLMIITDHINALPNPLIGPNIDELGPRFPAMTEAYSKEIIAKADAVAAANGIEVKHGCYYAQSGPTFETPSECKQVRTVGGDAVGMSTAPEVIAARHMGIPVFGMSVITNSHGDGNIPTHEEVQMEGAKASAKMITLFTELVKAL